MHRALRLILVAALALCAGRAAAEVVRDLYSARVPVTDQRSETLASAAQDALGQVLVKVSGSEEALGNPLVRKAMPEARSHVQQYVYNRADDGSLSARFEFDATYITGLVTQARLPLWTANRPRVLAWLVVEQGGQRQFVGLDSSPELAAELLREFDARGVPAQLPLFDLADATALSLDQAWTLDGNAVIAASGRYGVEDILLGRVVATSTGEWLGDWSYMFGRDRLDRSARAPESRGFARQGVVLAAESMASRYAVAPSAGSDGLVVMTVSGIENYGDYADLVDWLEDLELIDHANVRLITGDRLELGLVSLADSEDLAKLLELNRRLQPLASMPGQLDYQWQN